MKQMRRRIATLLVIAILATTTGMTVFAQEQAMEDSPSVELNQEDSDNSETEIGEAEPEIISDEQSEDTVEKQQEVSEEDENQSAVITDEKHPVTAMDEDGNVYEVEAGVGWVEEGAVPFAENDEKIVNFNIKGNVVTEYIADTGDGGYTNGAYGADAAYLGESNGKVKFMLSGVIGFVDKGSVQVINKTSAKSVSYYTVSGGRLIHKVTINVTNNSYASSLRCGPAPSYLAEGAQYYSYDGHYFYASNQYAVMLNDYRNNTRANSINPGNPYYNYYQYLPMRSTSVYSASVLDGMIVGTGQVPGDSKMRGIGTSLVSNQNTYGVNGLLMTGVAANESWWGKSDIAKQKNNLFGLAAVDSNPGNAFSYSSVSVCIKDFAETYMSKWWLNPNNWRYYGAFLGDKGSGVNVKYASDPYWGEKAAANAWLLDEIGGNKDRYRYTMGIKDTLPSSHQNLPIRAGSNAGAAVMYNTGTQSNTSFLLLESTAQNGFYKIMSDGVLNNSRTGIDGNAGKYNFSSMYGYIASNSIVIVNQGTNLESVGQFRDVRQGEWYYDYVKFVYERGIMTGMDAYSFNPVTYLDRGQFTTTLYRMQGSPSTSYSKVFPDVPDGCFYTLPVLWAYNNRVITGYESGNFGPSHMITREQMAVMMYRYAKFRGLNTSDNNNLNGFPDAAKVSAFSKEAMNWAVGANIIQGDQGKLNPQGKANRAQCATIITRFMQKYGL